MGSKKSRDRRRLFDNQHCIRAAILELENKELKYELDLLKKELALVVSNH